MSFRPFFILAGLVCLTCACVLPSEEELGDIDFDLSDPVLRRLFDYQNAQTLDSLYPFLKREEPTYRYFSALAFAAIRDRAAIDSLAPLLEDAHDQVRAAAAYALGQIGDPAAEPLLLSAFDRFDTLGVYRRSNRAILEAVGKCGGLDNLKAMATVTTYQPRDTALLEGQAWGIYRYALREIVVPEGTARMLALVIDSEFPSSVRLIAANYLYRARQISIDSAQAAPLAKVMLAERDPYIRMALTIGLGKSRRPEALDALLHLFASEEDYRVQCNILRALSNFDYEQVQATCLEALRSPNIHVAARAAQYFLENGEPRDATLYWRIAARDSLPWQAALPLYGAALRHLPRDYVDYREIINSQIRQRFARAESPFEKIAALQALSEFPWNFRFVQREGFQAKEGMVRAAAVRVLAEISQNPRKNPVLTASNITRELAIYFQQAVRGGDPQMMAIAAEELTNTVRNYRTLIDSLSFLERALASVDPQEDYFTALSLRNAYQKLSGNKQAVELEKKVNPIEWRLLDSLPANPIVTLRTTKGDIKLSLSTIHAPASVSNFLRLIQQDYYHDKYFYRVAPNFVIQGVESLDHDPVGFTIRSELPPLHFDSEGLLGMASLGNHTESTQFFITHSPALHLDGNYTIFGRVTEGMEVVHQIQVGDQLLEARIDKTKQAQPTR
jgi:cyclophilin family peptidyl-prolyl cis-trans isomerase/HEAT repeat protein